ncbi:hypothetical protein [Flavivirga spongiicola]|uniref:Uncharacterized protein n=1 Tax=Flavivirga spongiicola TaxID=421621 RepID=A0ABU7XSF0_9FLAO|nr:hypothetical protein [Flavivirga sp. MEBiC05379]MDO5978682.1 hypothetical protein [Flavivirga sp. MEBiC05379]
MTAFHYKAIKIKEDKETVTYSLNADFFLDPNEFIEVILKKKDLTVMNYDEVINHPDFSFSKKPLYWLQAKSTDDKIHFKEKIKHLA